MPIHKSVFLDTNVLLYGASTDSSEAAKRAVARDLLRRDDCVVPVQLLQESYVQATRPPSSPAIGLELAVALIRIWRRFHIVEASMIVFLKAQEIRQLSNFACWNCAIIAAPSVGGCDTLYTEDMQAGRTFDGVTIVNPFAA